jgi:hypothetical protein
MPRKINLFDHQDSYKYLIKKDNFKSILEGVFLKDQLFVKNSDGIY